MIDRYARPEMVAIWSEANRFGKWLEIEILAAEALAKLGKVPAEVPGRIRAKARLDVARIREIEEEVHHEVIAFLRCISESVGDDARFLHVGMTSSDVMDTGLSLQLKEASEIILEDVQRLLYVLHRQAQRYKELPMMGRTHGVHAEPITFGLKMALWYEEMKRNETRLKKAIADISCGIISGAVGTYSQIPPEVEAYVCERLGLAPDPISNQIIQRDRHAFFFCVLAVMASSIEKFAVEIRHLQRTEVLEAEEPFAAKQMGSSAMPHKRNPILSENVTGLARLIRSYSVAANENVALWHERDISHSSVERVIGPDATILTDFVLRRLTHVIENLCVYPENMKRNLALSGGAVFSQGVLLRLVEKGLSRDEAYRIVQRHGLAATKGGKDLKQQLLADPEVLAHLTTDEIDAIWDLKDCFKYVDTIYRRVFPKDAV
jgi:adenylosuccinate lyase